MPSIKITVVSLDSLPVAAEKILEFSGGRKVFAFYGEMGSGKTTLIKEICRRLGSQDNFSSPTYSIVNEYKNSEPGTLNPEPIYHIDLYRLKNREEALAIGIEEYIDGGNYCFIEWPELLETLLPVETVRVKIKVDGNERGISIFI